MILIDFLLIPSFGATDFNTLCMYRENWNVLFFDFAFFLRWLLSLFPTLLWLIFLESCLLRSLSADLKETLLVALFQEDADRIVLAGETARMAWSISVTARDIAIYFLKFY